MSSWLQRVCDGLTHQACLHPASKWAAYKMDAHRFHQELSNEFTMSTFFILVFILVFLQDLIWSQMGDFDPQNLCFALCVWAPHRWTVPRLEVVRLGSCHRCRWLPYGTAGKPTARLVIYSR